MINRSDSGRVATAELNSVLLLGADLVYLTVLSNELRALSRNATISAGPRPVRRAIKDGLGEPTIAVVCIDQIENVADIRSLMSNHPATTFLFLTETSPPRSAVAHAVHDCGGEVLSRQEKPLFIAATLMSIVAQKTAGAQSHE